jgi:23S rRNA (cytosine1962-C5)-methyltransferase
LAKQNAELNGVDVGEVIEGDAFEVLRRMRDRRAEFDLIILDPPKYSASAKHIERATRKYKDINLVGIKLLAPGGKLMTFSCSQSMDTDLFQKVVAGAAVDAKRDLRIIRRLGQPVDHPVHLHFPESEYLKGLLLQAD